LTHPEAISFPEVIAQYLVHETEHHLKFQNAEVYDHRGPQRVRDPRPSGSKYCTSTQPLVATYATALDRLAHCILKTLQGIDSTVLSEDGMKNSSAI
jgi:hypothetical protein